MLRKIKRLAYRAATALTRAKYRHIWGMKIGEGTVIARTAKLDTTNPRGVFIGDWTALSFDVAVIAHDFVNRKHLATKIGSYCLIGARSIILPGVTIGDHCVIASGSVVKDDVPSHSFVMGNPAKIVERGITTGKWGIREHAFVSAGGNVMREQQLRRELTAAKLDGLHVREERGLDFLLALPHDQIGQDLRALGFDSFGLVQVRAEMETRNNTSLDDNEWSEVRTGSDVLRFLKAPAVVRKALATEAVLDRQIEIAMPQMAIGGLSESWLMKELGDLHWTMLTSALGVKSSEIQDAAGERLYATFTTLRLKLEQPLSAFAENQTLDFRLRSSRFGAGLFFSNVTFGGGHCEIMSSFSKFGDTASNTSLVKGQPHLPDDFAIPALPAPPEFMADYRMWRAAILDEPIFETEYEILPHHDINGVGLLYFAAYPLIHDICLLRMTGKQAAFTHSTLERELYYFANSGPDDLLVFRVHQFEEDGPHRKFLASLSRKSDGKLMAVVRTIQSAKSSA